MLIAYKFDPFWIPYVRFLCDTLVGMGGINPQFNPWNVCVIEKAFSHWPMRSLSVRIGFFNLRYRSHQTAVVRESLESFLALGWGLALSLRFHISSPEN
jgi:hypothetical protein